MAGCAITVCDTEGTVIYQNPKSLDTFKRTGNMRGKSLMPCHNARSREIIRQLLETCGTNSYTIEKNGVKKMIYQSAWRKADGTVGGLVEISMEIPGEMPHHIRQ